VEGERERRDGNEMGRKRRRSPRVGSHPMSEILKNTLIAELI